jgi:hypothetical protein
MRRAELRIDRTGSRRRCALTVAAAVAAAVAACTTLDRHTIGGYTPAQLADIARGARDTCEAQRGPGNLPPHEFTTDGCSLFFDGTWAPCCVDHDKAYWCGGTADQRREADHAFRGCVAKKSSSAWGGLMWLGVRAGGAPWMPFWFRWGYGWDYPRPYDDAKP